MAGWKENVPHPVIGIRPIIDGRKGILSFVPNYFD